MKKSVYNLPSNNHLTVLSNICLADVELRMSSLLSGALLPLQDMLLRQGKVEQDCNHTPLQKKRFIHLEINTSLVRTID